MASNLKIFRAWIIATVLGLWLGAIVTELVFFLLSAWITSTAAAMGLEALLSGLMMGTCQWFVLKHDFKKAYWWIVTTALGNFFAAVFLISLFHTVLVFLADSSLWGIAPLFKLMAANNLSRALAVGFGLGVAQWLYLRTRQPNSAAWIAVMMGATVLSAVVWLVPIPLFQSPQAGIEGFLDIIQPSPHIHLITTVFHFARLSLVGVIQGGVMGIWLTDFVARKETR